MEQVVNLILRVSRGIVENLTEFYCVYSLEFTTYIYKKRKKKKTAKQGKNIAQLNLFKETTTKEYYTKQMEINQTNSETN